MWRSDSFYNKTIEDFTPFHWRLYFLNELIFFLSFLLFHLLKIERRKKTGSTLFWKDTGFFFNNHVLFVVCVLAFLEGQNPKVKRMEKEPDLGCCVRVVNFL